MRDHQWRCNCEGGASNRGVTVRERPQIKVTITHHEGESDYTLL